MRRKIKMMSRRIEHCDRSGNEGSFVRVLDKSIISKRKVRVRMKRRRLREGRYIERCDWTGHEEPFFVCFETINKSVGSKMRLRMRKMITCTNTNTSNIVIGLQMRNLVDM